MRGISVCEVSFAGGIKAEYFVGKYQRLARALMGARLASNTRPRRVLTVGELKMGLYHYTTCRNHADLMDADRLVPSKDKQHDSTHGPGWYLTDLGPSACERTLLRHCWPQAGSDNRVRHYLEVEVDGGCAVRLRKHVFFVPESSLARFHLVSQGEVFECILKPCEACPLNPEKR